jgi:hypothetical protein
MRKTEAAPVATRNRGLSAGSRSDASAELVCLALALAVIVLASRIASIW